MYDVSTGAVVRLSRSAAFELTGSDNRVIAVDPGPVPTNIFGPAPPSTGSTIPLRRGAVADVLAPIIFPASDAAPWITGQPLNVDGGCSLT